jgi:mono/diheme cytochrome c family protein
MSLSHAWAAAVLGGALLAPAASTADPRADYMLHCQGCHGPDGGGARGSVPSFRGQLAKFLWVPAGREYLVRVPGSSQSELGDARTAALLNWLLAEFSPEQVPPDFTPYDEAEISRVRRPPLVDVEGVRRSLILAIREVEAARR